MKFFHSISGLSLAAILLASSAIPAFAETPANTFVVARNIADVITFDPAEVFEFTAGRVVSNLYERVMMFEPDDLTKLVGGVTESYEFSEDGKVIKIKLRQGMTFHSGNPVTAEDVAYSLGRVIKLNKTPAFIVKQIGWTPENVDEAVKALDTDTVQISILADLSPALVLNLLSANVASVVDKKLVQENELNGDMGYGWLKNHSAGSGPYKLTNWKANELITLEANANDRHGAPAMKRIALRHIPEASAQRLLLEKGDVDAAMELTTDQVKGIMGKEGVTVDTYPKGYLLYLAVNMEHSILSNPKLREAMRYMVNYDGMVDSFLEGQYKVHQSFWPSGMWAASMENPYSYDIEKAKALVAEANIPADTSITIDTLNKSPYKEVAQSIQSSLSQLGIKSDIILSDGATLWPKYRGRKHDMIVARWGPDYADPHSNADAFAHNNDNRFEAKLTGKLTWRNAWSADDVTPLTAQAAAESDPATRFDIYQDLQDKVRQDSPFTIMFQAIGQVGRRSNVEGFINGVTTDQTFYRTIVKK